MRICLPNGLQGTLLWSEERGQGFHTAPPISYDGGYFANYQALDQTPMGAALTQARIDLVNRWSPGGVVVDVGIGGGRFAEDCNAMGFDVCPDAVRWLKDTGRWYDLYGFSQRAKYPPSAVTCWDSLEHIPDLDDFMARVPNWLFVSMPIYTGLHGVLTSKHYKPGEHLHYWTLAGFVAWAENQGFELHEVNKVESELGREGIMSFALKRVG